MTGRKRSRAAPTEPLAAPDSTAAAGRGQALGEVAQAFGLRPNGCSVCRGACRSPGARTCTLVTFSCESWIVKKAEHPKIDAFELWCWRRLLRVHWIAKRSSQSIFREINPEYSLKGLMLTLKLQYFGANS